MEELLALLGLGGGGLLVGEAYDKLGDIGDTAWDESQRIGGDANDMSDFQGFGVTGITGGGRVSPTGDVNFGLSNPQRDYAQQMLGLSSGATDPNSSQGMYGTGAYDAASSLLPGIAGTPGMREQEIYDRIRAMQMPEEQRQSLGLESRLAAQGRTGLRTAAYGGAPEQLALEKAREEAQNSASYEAIRLAMEGQGQDAQIANALSNSAGQALGGQGDLAQQYGLLQYAPQNALLDMFGAGSQAYGYEDIARRQGANQYAEAQMGGLEGMLGAGLGQANLMGQVGTGLISGAGGMMSSIIDQGGSLLGGAWDFLRGQGK